MNHARTAHTSRPLKSTNVRSKPVSLRAARAGLAWLGPRAPSLAAACAERLFRTARRHPRPEWERRLLDDATAHRVPYENGSLPVWAWGDGPRTVLLVHGWEGRGSQLGRFVAPLKARGFKVAAFDAPGHGDASLPRASLVDHARAVAAVAADLGPLAGVVGHSVGGAAALVATRFGFRAERYALLAPPMSPARFVAGFSQLLGLEPAVRSAMIGLVEARYGLTLAELDVRPYAERLREPLLVVHDEGDTVVPASDGAVVAGAAPNGRFVSTADLGHRRILESSSVIDEVSTFLGWGGPCFEQSLEGELYDPRRRW